MRTPPRTQFERTLQDLVKGLRDCKSDADTEAFISKALAEVKEEMASREMPIKATALQKACYVRAHPQPRLGPGGGHSGASTPYCCPSLPACCVCVREGGVPRVGGGGGARRTLAVCVRGR